MKKQLQVFFLIALLGLVLTACLPGLTTVVRAPVFSLRAEVQVISLELPIPFLSAGRVIFRVPMDVYNPNDFEVSLSRIDFDFFLNQRLAVTSSFSEGLALRAQGSTTVPLDIVIPLENGIALIEDISRLMAGQRTAFALDGRVSIEVFGALEVYAKTRLLSGQIN